MNVLAILFLVGFALRGVFWLFDDGFGGPVWTTIYYASALTWLVGLTMAVHVLTGITVKVGL